LRWNSKHERRGALGRFLDHAQRLIADESPGKTGTRAALRRHGTTFDVEHARIRSEAPGANQAAIGDHASPAGFTLPRRRPRRFRSRPPAASYVIPAVNDYDRSRYPHGPSADLRGGPAIKGFLRGLDVAHPNRCRRAGTGMRDGSTSGDAIAHPVRATWASTTRPTRSRGPDDRRNLTSRRSGWKPRTSARVDPTLGEFDYIVAHGASTPGCREVEGRPCSR